MCIRVCVLCSAVMLFTCALVISRPASKEGVGCETWAVGTSSKILGGPEQTRNILGRENQHMAVQVCTNYDCINCLHKEDYLNSVNIICALLWLLHVHEPKGNTDWCLFLQVKNKPWLPWVYSWIWHRPKQYCFGYCYCLWKKTLLTYCPSS